MVDYVELIEKRKSSGKCLNRNEEISEGRNREGKTGERKLFIVCVSPYWRIRVPPRPCEDLPH